MSPSKSGFEAPDDWAKFSSYLMETNRYVLKARWKRFLASILRTSKKRTHIIQKGAKLVRARIGSEWDEYEDEDGEHHVNFGPLSQKELTAPPKEKANSGRANPKGIPYLYLSTKVETAIAEARPWKKADVSVGSFEIIRKIRILDVSDDKPKTYIGDFNLLTGEKIIRHRTQDDLEAYVWGDINKAFSIPIQPGNEDIKYIPTQFIAEFFKNRGYQAIAYKSSMDESGHNLVLFYPALARLTGAGVYEISNIKYTFEQNGNPYVVSRRRRGNNNGKIKK